MKKAELIISYYVDEDNNASLEITELGEGLTPLEILGLLEVAKNQAIQMQFTVTKEPTV